jgi:hypothetical protein
MLKIPLILTLTLASVCSPTFANASECASLVGTCDYYQCVERELLSCGETGYTLGYGYYYCKKFESVQPWPFLTPHEKELFPVEWGPWLAKTARCLHSTVDEYLSSASGAASCEGLRAVAFASHANCYTSEDSFCFLPPRQVAHIGNIISVRGFSERETREQVQQTAAICVQQLDDRIKAEESPLNRVELNAYRKSWQLLSQRF